MQIKAVLFDYDGTISDRTRSSYENYKILLHYFFPEMDVHSLEFESRLQKCLLWDEYGTISKKEVLKHIKEKWREDLDIEDGLRQWYRTFPDHQFWTKDMQKVLLALKKNYKVGLVTNGPHDRQWPKIRKMKLEEIFDTIIVSEDFGVKKPDRRIYEAAAQNLSVPCSACAYVGDTFSTDIVGALNAGMFPVWYCGERAGVTDKDICIIQAMTQLPGVLEKIV